MTANITVIKVGGSVLTGPQGFTRAARCLASRLSARPDEKLLAIVSAESGVTDALLSAARSIVDEPDQATLDLLWSTGEIRSTALLAFALHALGVKAAAVNVHQTGLLEPSGGAAVGGMRVRPLRLHDLLTRHDVVVAPGFLARGPGDTLVSLGRGGSDLTAVLLAAGLGAARCELLKDVPGYFTADPKRDPSARPVEALTYAKALEMADAGCELVQRQALEAARLHQISLVITAIGHERFTVIHEHQPAA